jgi:antitoxin (DNA-binding transcriptional repressor) of toxin-antitoxin stability system
MTTVPMREAQERLRELCDRVVAGEQISVLRDDGGLYEIVLRTPPRAAEPPPNEG